MRDELHVFRLLGEASASIFPLAREIMGVEFEKHFSEQRFYQPTFLAYQLAPKTLSADLISRRTPYANPAPISGLLAEVAEAGYLEPAGKSYRISDQGKGSIESVHRAFYSHINQVGPFPEHNRTELAGLLERLVDAISGTDQIEEKLCFEISHSGHPGVDPDSLARIDQLLDDMNAFRDDAHLAAWKPFSVKGLTWESLSFVWNGAASTAEKLAELLAFRNYTREEYQAALDDLSRRGWIAAAQDGFAVTQEGGKIRQDAEDATNTNYFAPWKVLTDQELSQLAALLQNLTASNQKLSEQAQAG